MAQKIINKILRKLRLIEQSSKNPFKIEELKRFNELEKWLMMNEGRPQSMNWIYLTPKHK